MSSEWDNSKPTHYYHNTLQLNLLKTLTHFDYAFSSTITKNQMEAVKTLRKIGLSIEQLAWRRITTAKVGFKMQLDTLSILTLKPSYFPNNRHSGYAFAHECLSIARDDVVMNSWS